MPRRILLVDDDKSVLLTLKAVLELNRFDVVAVSSVEEACRKLETAVYEIVITDVRMEGESSGFDVVRAARAQSYRPATAVLTAFPPQDDSWKKEPVDCLLVKPMGTKQLVEALEALLLRHERGPGHSRGGAPS